MTPTNEPITTEELRALIELYRRMKMRVDDQLTALQREYDVRVSVLNDEDNDEDSGDPVFVRTLGYWRLV